MVVLGEAWTPEHMEVRMKIGLKIALLSLALVIFVVASSEIDIALGTDLRSFGVPTWARYAHSVTYAAWGAILAFIVSR